MQLIKKKKKIEHMKIQKKRRFLIMILKKELWSILWARDKVVLNKNNNNIITGGIEKKKVNKNKKYNYVKSSS